MTSVTNTRPEYDKQLEDVTRNRDAVAGERKVKEETTKYLPPLASMCITEHQLENGKERIVGTNVSAQGRVSYNKYLSLTYFYGATGRTVDGLTGLIFRKDPQIDLQPNIEYLDTNVNGKGDSLRKQSQAAVIEGFITPRSLLLVDFPNIRQQVSIQEAETNNLRPKILHYPFESIINWHFDLIDNQQKLTLLVLMEKSETLKNRFEVDFECTYRVLEMIDGVYHQTIMNSEGEELSETQPVLVNGETSNEIPAYFIEVGAEGKSVINDLVDANFNHYRFFADYAAKEHASAFPVFWETGAQDEDQNIAIGPGTKWSNRSSDAAFGVMQSESDGGSMRQYLLDMEQRMAALGAEMLKPRIASAESAEAKSLDQVAQNSTVGNVAINVSEAYEKAINFANRWLGGSEESTYRLSTDYNPKGLTGNDLTALFATYQGGGMSFDTFYENLQRGEVANPERTAEDEQALIQNEGTGLE